MILVSQQFLIFKKYNSQETIFILELTWLKEYMGILQLRYEMYCQFINFPISFNKKRKQQQNKTKQNKNNEYSYDLWQAEKFRIEKLILLISFCRNQN